MPLDFPSSPANGAVYEQYVYDSALPGWRSKGGAVAATYTSDTAPSGAVKGDMWYRTSDGTTYVYVVDADTSQWVEIRSEISTSKVGLVPIVPTSVAVSSGTATVGGAGDITFTGVTTMNLEGVFSSAYTNYSINLVLNQATVADVDVQFRLRVGGADSAGSYYTGGTLQNGGTLAAVNNLNVTTWPLGRTHIGTTPNSHAAINSKIFQPFLARPTTYFTDSISWTNSATLTFNFGGFHTALTSYTGMTLFANSGTFGGILEVYGWN